jgi:hypothetical protein
MAGQYRFKDSNGNIVAQISASVEGAIAFSGSVVDFTQANNVILGNVQLAGTASNALLLDGFDSQAFAFTSSIHPFTASTNIRLDSIETISASNISRLNSLEEKTGSLATTGSNIFYGIQTFSGSLYVQDNLIVQGSSSLQNITASAVSIGTNIVYLNTDTPAVRYAGLTVQDSGSSAGVTGSILWDSLCNKWIYSNPSTVGYSGGMLISGPRTSNLGEEIGTTACSLMVGQGGDHISSSTLFHYENATCFYGTSYIKSTGGAYYSGNVGIGTENAVANLTLKENESCKALVLYGRTSDNLVRIDFYRADETCFAGRIQIDNGTTSNLSVRAQGALQFQTGGSTNRLIIDNTGITCFQNTICTPLLTVNSAVRIYGSAGGIGCAYIVTATGTNEQPAIILEKAGGYGQSEIRTYYNDVPNYGMAFRAGNTTGVYINSSGYLGVGTSNPLTSFTVKSTNDNGYGLTRPSSDATYHWRLSTTETGGDAYTVRYNTFNNEMLFTTYSGGGTGGNIIFRTSTVGGSETERVRINCNGITTFSCQICVSGGLIVRGGCTTWSTFNVIPDNPGGSGAQCNTVLAASITGCSGWGPQLRFSGGTGGFIDIGQNSSGGFVVETSDNPRLNIAQNGNSTFSCLVTTDSLAITTNALHGIKTFNSGATSSYVINLPAEFPNALLTGGNVWGVIGKALFFSGGQAEVRDFYIARNSGGSWSSANYGPQVVTSGGILQSVTGSGTCITINMNAGSYVTVEITAMVR